MDSSENYFWQSTEVTNGGDVTGMLQNPVENYIQHDQIIQNQNVDSDSPKSSTMLSSTSSPQQIFGQQVEVESSNTKGMNDEMISIVNPDAIEPKPRSYTCRICQMTFPNKSEVTVHSRLHTDHQGKPYRCSFCGKGFSTNFYLKQHERIHSGQKPYRCPMCDHTFKQLSHVQQHVRTHTGVRPYKCHWPNCGKAFLQQSHLKSHEARHTPKPDTGIRPYKCHWPECGKSFAHLTNLKSHVARHTPGKKTRKPSGANNKKIEQVTGEEGAGFDLGNVINQAAAAANIVPGGGIEDEAEIRPFLCPGCSKLYVREATFKKHLEECKTKLQLSISATATALGIDPPPMPTSRHTSSDFDMSLSQINNPSSLTAKRPKLAMEENIEFDITTGDLDQGLSGTVVRKSKNIHVKQERVPVNFIARQQQNQVTVTSSDDSHQPSNSIQIHNVLPFADDDENDKQQNTGNASTPISIQNLILTNIPGSVSSSSTPSLILTPQPPSSTSTSHSTINQDVIRWQWDQPGSRLQFP